MGADPQVRDYIRRAALMRNIDPAIALRVAGHEAMNVFDPSQPDRGGDLGSSFGPFQLHYGGMTPSMPNPGMGDEFTRATGLHASDPSTWRQQVDFALDKAAQRGWGAWMGAKAEGITGKMGIGGRAGPIGVSPYEGQVQLRHGGGVDPAPVNFDRGPTAPPLSAAQLFAEPAGPSSFLRMALGVEPLPEHYSFDQFASDWFAGKHPLRSMLVNKLLDVFL